MPIPECPLCARFKDPTVLVAVAAKMMPERVISFLYDDGIPADIESLQPPRIVTFGCRKCLPEQYLSLDIGIVRHHGCAFSPNPVILSGEEMG